MQSLTCWLQDTVLRSAKGGKQGEGPARGGGKGGDNNFREIKNLLLPRDSDKCLKMHLPFVSCYNIADGCDLVPSTDPPTA